MEFMCNISNSEIVAYIVIALRTRIFGAAYLGSHSDSGCMYANIAGKL
jgi:hypothetical protein